MNVLEYESIPIKYEMQITPASLKVEQKQPSVQVSKSGGELKMQQQHIKVRLDTVEMRSSMGFKGIADLARDAAQRGYNAAMEGIANYVQAGDDLKNIHKGANIPDMIFNRMTQRSQGELALLPLSPTDISWQPGGVQTQYTPVKQDFNWNTGREGANIEFVPGSTSMNILQYPEIRFRYVGQPIYVPPSAAPEM